MPALLDRPEFHAWGIHRGTDLQDCLGDSNTWWCAPGLAGRMVELSGWQNSAALTLSLEMALQMQRQHDPVAWLTAQPSLFFPPDVAASGLDLSALAVIVLPSSRAVLQAAERLLRSGGFGLVIVDLGATLELTLAAQSRLASLAKKHDCVLLCLTHKTVEQPSLGSLISLRAHSSYRKSGDDCFVCELEALKDKRRAPGWKYTALYSGPEGLR